MTTATQPTTRSRLQIIEGIKMTAGIRFAFHEAVRRYHHFQAPEGRPIATAWIGLGTRTTYCDALSAGLMEFQGKYALRCSGWLRFTQKRLEVFAAWLALNSQQGWNP